MQLLGAGNQYIVGGIDKATAALMRSGALNQLFKARPTQDNSTKPPGWYGSDLFNMPSTGDNSIVPDAVPSVLDAGSNDLGAVDLETTNQ